MSSLLQKNLYRRNTCTCWVPFIKFEITRIFRNSRICPDITNTYPSSARVYIGKYLQLQHAVSIPEKISICLNRGLEESMEYYYTLRAEATSIFFTVKVRVYQYLSLGSSQRENVDSSRRVDDYRNFPKFCPETRLECVWKKFSKRRAECVYICFDQR